MSEEDMMLFLMPGAREVVELSGGGQHIEMQVSALEKVVNSNPSLAFDLAKTLIESVCKTILNDRGYKIEKDPNLRNLTRVTLEQLQILPANYSEATIEKQCLAVTRCLEKTIDGFILIFEGIGELRNKEGLASHGKDAYTQMLDPLQAQLMARAADAVVNFLYKSHRYYFGPRPSRGLAYEESEDFNQFVDSIHPEIVIFEDYSFKPSDVLYNFDPVAYNDQRISFASLKENEEHQLGEVGSHGE